VRSAGFRQSACNPPSKWRFLGRHRTLVAVDGVKFLCCCEVLTMSSQGQALALQGR
jgi:hypothetical protein